MLVAREPPGLFNIETTINDIFDFDIVKFYY